MRIAFVWTGLTSYMADCWRHLSTASDINLKVWIDVSSAAAQAVSFDASTLMAGIPCAILHDASPRDFSDDLVRWKPDILFIVGWHSVVCRAAVLDVRLGGIPKVCCFDMPWRWKLRCLVAPMILGRFLRHYRAAFVPGVVCARYARWLGFKKIYHGLFAIDTKRFACAYDEQGPSRDYFLYIGRNSSEKRLGDLRRAHALYRARGGRFDLRVYGKGLESGFVRPEDVPSLMRHAAAFVLASDFDPWPLVLLEAMSAGCPVIASDRCTNYPELGKHWRVFRCGDVEGLAQQMSCVEEEDRDVADMRDNLMLAQQYDCRAWVERVKKILQELVA